MMMKLVPVIAAFVTAGSALPLTASPSPPFDGTKAQVVEADLLKVTTPKRVVGIRLFGVFSPRENEPGAEEARAYTSAFVKGHTLTIYPVSIDASRNTVGWVFRGSRCLNRELVQHGWARWKHADLSEGGHLGQYEAEARSQRRGIWAGEAALKMEAARRRAAARPKHSATKPVSKPVVSGAQPIAGNVRTKPTIPASP